MGSASLLTDSFVVRDPGVDGHGVRVTAVALRIAEVLGAASGAVDAIRLGGPLHDIGKLGIDQAILRKPGELDADELAEIRRHPVIGFWMLRRARSLRAALACVLSHHERWDGGGYPHRLDGDAIPLEARIVAVADAYDAMVSDRPYRAALTHDEALAEVERCAGSQFDPVVAAALLRGV